MSDKPLDLPALDKLHASATAGEWLPCGDDRGGCICGKIYHRERELQIVHPYDEDLPHPQGEEAKANALWIASIHNAFPALSARLKLLEQTLRGVIEEKRQSRDACLEDDDAIAADALLRQIAWLERALGGEL